jgi:hypothetical protein
MWGRMASCAPVGSRRYPPCFRSSKGVTDPLQVEDARMRKQCRFLRSQLGIGGASFDDIRVYPHAHAWRLRAMTVRE